MPDFVADFSATGRPAEPDGRLDAPALHRNQAPIWAVLAPHLQDRRGDVLEIGSGTGQHCVTYAARTPHLIWWPSDPNPAHLASIDAWRRHSGLANVRPAQRLDAADPGWTWPGGAPEARLAALFCANVLHISPWATSEGLVAGAARHLGPGGHLFVYGPFKRDGVHTAPSNEAFDASLRASNPAWGLRDIADLAALARRHGLALVEAVPMPANNFVLIFCP